MDLEGIVLSEIRQRKTDTVCYHLYVESKKIKQTNEYNKTQIHKYREQTGGYQRGEGRRVGQDRGRGSRDTNYYV